MGWNKDDSCGGHITPVVKLNLKLQCLSQVYVIIAMHMYL